MSIILFLALSVTIFGLSLILGSRLYKLWNDIKLFQAIRRGNKEEVLFDAEDIKFLSAAYEQGEKSSLKAHMILFFRKRNRHERMFYMYGEVLTSIGSMLILGAICHLLPSFWYIPIGFVSALLFPKVLNSVLTLGGLALNLIVRLLRFLIVMMACVLVIWWQKREYQIRRYKVKKILRRLKQQESQRQKVQ